MEKTKILFTQYHDELLAIDNETDESHFTELHRLLKESDFSIDFTSEKLSNDHLKKFKILVLGAPKYDLDDEESNVILQFTENGGGLLLVKNSDTVLKSLPHMDKLCRKTGIEFKEYLNYQHTFLSVFQAHYITANVKSIRVLNTAALSLNKNSHHLASTELTQEPIVACSYMSKGRAVAIGDIDLFKDNLINKGDNRTFLENTFIWLSARNLIDIEEVVVPETVKWAQVESANKPVVLLKLCNRNSKETRPWVKCVLDSDAGAIISNPVQTIHDMPVDRTIIRQWGLLPQNLGDQRLRLAVHINDRKSLFFDKLMPKMHCLASGYLNLKTMDKDGNLKTTFKTNEHFDVKGIFQWAEGIEVLPLQLELIIDKGLMLRGRESGIGTACWYIQATDPGVQNLELKVKETGQSLPASVTIYSSNSDQLTEIKTAYVYPLEAEIFERLKQAYEPLGHTKIQTQPFNILPPNEYIRMVYEDKDIQWLEALLEAAYREKYYNRELIRLILIYIVPTYLPGRGAFIPYDPKLASHLGRIHSNAKKRLEYNLLCSEEIEDINIKQNIAAYLLHEKYGHGFFYTQTRLGRQLSILGRYDLRRIDENLYETYKKAAKFIKDSSIIVNEGFAAWMELTFLSKLDREARQAAFPRWMILIEESSLNPVSQHNDILKKFPSLYESRYREGLEHLDFIDREFGLQYAVQALQIATDIDFNIKEIDGQIHFEFEVAKEISQRLSNNVEPETWCSHIRLRKITDCLNENREDMKTLIQNQYCSDTAIHGNNLLKQFLSTKLNWRIS